MSPKSRFSDRVDRIDISGIRKIFESATSDAINLGLGQPDFDTPSHIKRAAVDAINEGFTGYTEGAGMPELKEAISRKFKSENNFIALSEEILVTSGASEALHLAIQALVGGGDEILMPDPGFVSYSALAEVADGKLVGVPLREDLSMDPEEVKERITKKTKAFIVNSPANPTGAVQTEDDMRAFAEIADDQNITLISDEVYEHLIYEGEHESPARFGENVITINAVSKTYAMTGWRLGYLAARKEYIEQMLKIHSYIQACAQSVSQKAAIAALNGPQGCVKEMRDEFKRRRDFVAQSLREMGLSFSPPKGAFYIFPKVRDEVKMVEELLKNGVIVTPGSAFGEYGRDHMRISYATSMQNLKDAFGIIKRVLDINP
ncbi:MAG: pyridoxal phosphate-dependent aminotransferase [Halobacteriota archaeon]|nr:pyridoxal phosphate-dependent aminotransferase [Halobacteriota archaeon]